MILSKINKLFSLEKIERKLFFEALLSSYWIWLKHFFIKFKKLEKLYKCTGNENNDELALKIKIAIKRTAKLTFWNNKCLIQSFVARKMLNKRNLHSKAYLGLLKDETSFNYKAHAWVICKNIEVIDGEKGFAKVHEF